MKTTIFIPAYKSESYIIECIKSIRNQRNVNSVINLKIAVDACPYTARELRKHNIPFDYSETNQGAYILRNTLIKNNPADNYIYFDSDDVMCPDYISECLKYIDEYDLILPAKTNCNEQLKRGRSRIEHGGSMMFTHKVIEEIGYFYPARVAGDSDFLNRASAAGLKIKRLNKVLYLRRKHNNSLTRDKKTGICSSYRKTAWKEMQDNFKIYREPVTCEFGEIKVFPAGDRVILRKIY